jgi:vancomycin resistance protein YoaR
MTNGKFTIIKLTTVIFLLTVFTALLVTHNIGTRIGRHFYGVKAAVTLESIPMEKLLEREVRTKVEKMASVMDRAPRNARYDRKRDKIVLELPGMKVDVDTTVKAVMSAAPGEEVGISVIRLEPEITADIFRSIQTKISAFSTSGGGSAGRTDNLYVSAKYMNGYILAPGEVFSFNGATGPRTFARGYGMAPVVGGMGIGGGVCQTATTIYNAARIAGMEIVERHPHSIQVGYVPPGRDATVTNYIDMKFRNSTDKFIQIRSGAGGGHVWVQLWSQ